MDHALAPPLRLVIKHPSTTMTHDQVADAVGLFLNSYAARTGGAPASAAAVATHLQQPGDQLASVLGTSTADSAAAAASAGTTGGNAVVTSQLNRLREHLRAES